MANLMKFGRNRRRDFLIKDSVAAGYGVVGVPARKLFATEAMEVQLVGQRKRAHQYLRKCLQRFQRFKCLQCLPVKIIESIDIDLRFTAR